MLQLRRKNATIIRIPPMMDAPDRESPVSNQSTMATRKMVSNAATDERTGEVSDIRTRKEPEKAVGVLLAFAWGFANKGKTHWH